MTKVRNAIPTLLLLLILTAFLTSCFQCEAFEYTGDYPELYSVAISLILGARGYIPADVVGGWRSANPNIVLLEEDNFGRVLFRYNDDSFSRIVRAATDDSPTQFAEAIKFVYIIVQRVNGDYVYFYPHYNFIIRRGRLHNTAFESYFEDIPMLSDEDLDILKEANSWNQELSDNRAFERVRIVRQKEDGPFASEAERGMIYLRTDRYGRSIYARLNYDRYFVRLLHHDNLPGWEIGFITLTDRFNYQTELRLFLEENGWNTPLEEP